MIKFQKAGIALGLIALAATPSTQLNSVDAIATANNAFAFSLYQQIAAIEKGNVFFSPFSISTALAMTYAGADSTTADEIQKAMHFQQNTPEFHSAYGAYLMQLYKNAEGNIKWRVANRLWGEKRYELIPSFVEINREAYQSPLQLMDFMSAPDQSRITINNWIADQTEQRIKDLIPPGSISIDTRLVLTNAIYFKGDWMYQFNKRNTRDQKFTLADGTTTKTPFMNFEGALEYAETERAKMLRLPYKGGKHSMILVLPHKTEDLALVEAQMNPASFQALNRYYQPEVILALPKFKMTLPLGLNSYLRQLGMRQAFASGADFSKMTPTNDLWISNVLHKAFIEIDEEGTEAAAATAVIITIESASPHDKPKPMEFIADHPFLFYIIDDETQSILFMGRLMVPEL